MLTGEVRFWLRVGDRIGDYACSVPDVAPERETEPRTGIGTAFLNPKAAGNCCAVVAAGLVDTNRTVPVWPFSPTTKPVTVYSGSRLDLFPPMDTLGDEELDVDFPPKEQASTQGA